jgi:hypothetical protein
MAIPSYKQININNSTEDSIITQLEPHSFDQLPYVIDISHLSDQFEAISIIEDFFSDHQITNYPYPIYIISTLKNYHGPFSIFESLSACPKFYKQKLKQLNARENKIMQKVQLKQKNLLNMQGHNFEEDLIDYSLAHKLIHHLHKESLFLNRLQEKLKRYYVK